MPDPSQENESARMLFNSPIFIFLFLPITLAGFYWFGRRESQVLTLGWLILASLIFYGYWNPIYLLLILGSVAVNYSIGRRLYSYETRGRRGWMWLGIALNLGLLGYFKYAGFLSGIASAMLGGGLRIEDVVLPLAISFFTFQQISFLVDACRHETSQPHWLSYLLYVTFFPQLIAGPIVHHKEFLTQVPALMRAWRHHSHLVVGLSIFIIGLCKKVLIADNLALDAAPIFAAAERGDPLHMLQAWRGLVAYTFQIYFDFSGYSDMAIGLARCFGVRLPQNFRSPYRASSIIEFWRCWHITLSRFLRDYLYIPLGGGRRGQARRSLNLMVTMLLGGLWHGAGWTFVMWGGLHGALLMLNHGWLRMSPWAMPRSLARMLTLLAVMFAWIFFRAESFEGALHLLGAFTLLPAEFFGSIAGLLQPLGFEIVDVGVAGADRKYLWLFVVLTTFCWYMPNTQELFSRYRPVYESEVEGDRTVAIQRRVPALIWRPTRGWGIVMGLLALLATLSLSRVSEFLYFQF